MLEPVVANRTVRPGKRARIGQGRLPACCKPDGQSIFEEGKLSKAGGAEIRASGLPNMLHNIWAVCEQRMAAAVGTRCAVQSEVFDLASNLLQEPSAVRIGRRWMLAPELPEAKNTSGR